MSWTGTVFLSGCTEAQNTPASEDLKLSYWTGVVRQREWLKINEDRIGISSSAYITDEQIALEKMLKEVTIKVSVLSPPNRVQSCSPWLVSGWSYAEPLGSDNISNINISICLVPFYAAIFHL